MKHFLQIELYNLIFIPSGSLGHLITSEQVNLALTFIADRFEHFENAPLPITETFLGIVTPVNFLHPKNAQSPIILTPLGIEIPDRFSQQSKA